MARSPNQPLRSGFTTGACATAGARAAVMGLLPGGMVPDRVTITLPRGETPTFEIVDAATGDGWAEVAVEKDAGDDPDVTHGALIRTRVARAPAGTGVAFRAGTGVGTVTRPGLPIPVGDPAINPVPRQMIAGVLRDAAHAAAVPADFIVTISVPGGAALADKTWNPRLGIEGGLSILGTTGIVRPFSCAAWIASIHRGIDVAVASGVSHVVGATGATSEAAARAVLDLPEIAYLDMGDFAGGVLKYLRDRPMRRLTLAGGIGKMTKLAQGALDLHSGRSQVDFGKLGLLVPERRTAIGAANTALEALQIAGPPLADAVAMGARGTAIAALRGAPIAVDVLVVDRAGTIVGRAGP